VSGSSTAQSWCAATTSDQARKVRFFRHAMKILTKEEEQAHYKWDPFRLDTSYTLDADNYSATLKGGIGGGLAGALVGALGVYGATVRYPAFRQLTLPLRVFLITSAGTFAGTDIFFLCCR